MAERRPLDARLLRDLVGRRTWRLGITASIPGSAPQILARHFGPLALVQPQLHHHLVS